MLLQAFPRLTTEVDWSAIPAKSSLNKLSLACQKSNDHQLNLINSPNIIMASSPEREDKPANCSKTAAVGSLAVMALNDTKAGMDGLDTEKINAIIEEASRGSKFYEAKAKSQERISRQVEAMKKSLTRLTQAEIDKATREMDLLAAKFNAERVLDRIFVHVDMDMFYAAVEMRDNPNLKSKPMAVGSMGMMSTSNYVARKFGVRAGMPGFIGKKLCPDLVLVRHNFDKYRSVSEVVRGVFREYDPNFSPMSLDEAYLDITEHLKGFPDKDPESVVQEIRRKIEERTSLTASAGIAPNTLLAKICSDRNKPNGQFYLKSDVEKIMNFMESLPIRKVSGIGNVTEQLLKAVGVQTCKDMFEKRGILKLLFSEISSTSFLRISLGIGSTNLSEWSERDRKSLSTETTFKDTSIPEELNSLCHQLCEELSDDLRKNGLLGRAVTLKIKTDKFRIRTKIQNLFDFTDEVGVIEKAAKSLLRHFMETADEKPLKLRLMGVRMSEFKHDMDMDDDASGGSSRQTKLDSFLRKERTETKRSFSCPICAKDVLASNENAFNRHLDECLEQQKERADLDKNDVKQEEFEVESSSSSSPFPKSGDAKAKSTQHCDFASETNAHVVCPICSEPFESPEQLESVNRHIDECLSLEKIVGNKRKSSEESQDSKRVRRTIKNYFEPVAPTKSCVANMPKTK